MRLSQIRVFLAVVDAGSLRAAARALGVSQPGITKSLRSLEEELHVRLLERSQHGVVPTRAGAAFVAHARTVQSTLRKVDEELAQLAGERSGSVAFGLSHGAIPIVPPALSRFRQQFPGARIRIVEGVWSTLLPMVRDETLDFIVARPPDDKRDPSIAARPLFQSEMVVAARTGHPQGEARSLADLLDAGWVTFVPPGSLGMLQQAFTAAGLPRPKTLVHCESNSAAIALVAETDLVTLIPRSMLAKPFTGDTIQALALEERLPRQTLSLCRRADARLTPLAAAMVKAVTAAGQRMARSA